MSSITMSHEQAVLLEREVRQVFDQCDENRDGFIDHREMEKVISMLLGKPASTRHIFNMMSHLDENSDGSIEWPEFRNILIRWIAKESKETLRPENFSYAQLITRIFIQKCQVDPDNKAISSDTFADRKQSKQSKQSVGSLPVLTGCSTLHGLYPASDEGKAEARAVTKNILAAIQTIARRGQGEGHKWLTDPNTRTTCASYFAELMAVCRVYRRPEERQNIKPLLETVFTEVSHPSLVEQMVHYLDAEDEALRLSAVRFLAAFAQGRNTPGEKRADEATKDMCVRAGLVAALNKLLEPKAAVSAAVRIHAIEAVGNLGADHERFRYLLLSTGFLSKLASWVHAKTETTALRVILRSLSILGGETHTETLPFKQRVSILPRMCEVLLQASDPEVLVHTLTCLAYLLPDVHINDNAEAFYRRICELASIKEASSMQIVRRATLKLIVRLFAAADPAKGFGGLHVMVSDLLPICRDVMIDPTSDGWSRLHACQLFGVLTCNPSTLPAMVQTLDTKRFERTLPPPGTPKLGLEIPKLVKSLSLPDVTADSLAKDISDMYKQQSMQKAIPATSSFSPGEKPRKPSSRPSIIRLSESTDFTSEQLLALQQQLKAASGGSDTLDMGTFQIVMSQHGFNDSSISEQLFHSFDKNRDGSLSFHEIAVGMSVLLGGSFQDRLLLAFRAYDLDDNGTISKEEYVAIMKASLLAKGFDFKDKAIRGMCEMCFNNADTDQNGALDFDEFRKAVMTSELGVQLFWQSEQHRAKLEPLLKPLPVA